MAMDVCAFQFDWKTHGVHAHSAYTFLPEMHLATDTASVPFHTHVQPVCHRGTAQARTHQGTGTCHLAHTEMQPLGRQRIRSRALILETTRVVEEDNVYEKIYFLALKKIFLALKKFFFRTEKKFFLHRKKYFSVAEKNILLCKTNGTVLGELTKNTQKHTKTFLVKSEHTL